MFGIVTSLNSEDAGQISCFIWQSIKDTGLIYRSVMVIEGLERNEDCGKSKWATLWQGNKWLIVNASLNYESKTTHAQKFG